MGVHADYIWQEFMWRPGTGTNMGSAGGTYVAAPTWLKLARTGNVFIGYGSPDGITWTQVGGLRSYGRLVNPGGLRLRGLRSVKSCRQETAELQQLMKTV